MFLIDSYRYADAGGGGDAYSTAVLADSPIAYWRLGESSGTTAEDISGNEYDGTYVNTPTLGVSGLISVGTDTAVSLDAASDEHVEITAHLAAFKDLTEGSIECWFQLTDADEDAPLVVMNGSTNQRLLIRSGRNQGVRIYFLTSSVITDLTSDEGIDEGVHHIVVTQNGTAFRAYIDGSELTLTGTNNGNFWDNLTSAAAMYIGRDDTSSVDTPFGGTMDEVAIYDYALSPAQALAHYNAGIGS